MTTYTAIDEHLDRANDAANDAAQSSVIALGLYELIDRFRFRDPSAPVPAPGTDGAPDEVRQAALAALHAAASARILHAGLSERALPAEVVAKQCPELVGSGTVVALADDRTVADCASLLDVRRSAEQAAEHAARALRRVAQVGLGVAQYAYEDDDTELVERTCITLLVDGPVVDGHPSDDDHRLRGKTRPEVGVEIAGVLARFLVTPDDATNWIEVRTPAGEVRTIDFTEDGCLRIEGLGTFQEPVTISEVVEALLDVCADVDGTEPRELVIEWLVDHSF